MIEIIFLYLIISIIIGGVHFSKGGDALSSIKKGLSLGFWKFGRQR